MNIEYIEHETILNGEGIRCVVWTSGCNHHCPGCQNPETWNPKSGHAFNADDLKELYKVLENPYISGVTFSGGDPLHPANVNEVTALAEKLKKDFPNKTIWLYTGNEWEEIENLEIMNYIDVAVVGRFVMKLLDVKYPWAGSTNQRVIDVNKTKKNGEIVLYE